MPEDAPAEATSEEAGGETKEYRKTLQLSFLYAINAL